MTRRIDPIEFASLWNESMEIDRLCIWFDRSKSSVLAAASSFRARGYELRHRDEEAGNRNKIYTPSPEEIRMACLEIRKKRAAQMRDGIELEFNNVPTSLRFSKMPPELRPRRKPAKQNGSG